MTNGIDVALSTFLSVIALRFINTGDRMADNALTTLISTFVIGLIAILRDHTLYNKFVYYVLDRPSDPRKARISWYKWIHTTVEDTKKYAHHDTESYISCEINSILRTIIDRYNMFGYQSSLGGYKYYVYGIFHGEVVYIRSHNYNSSTVLEICSETSTAAIGAIICLTKEVKELSMSSNAGSSSKLYVSNTKDQKQFSLKSTISTRKTFDKLFYDEKLALIALLDKFKAGTLYPLSTSMDNKLGILLYGPPGTGKTGTICAIANYLQRDVININFAETRTCAQLDTILDPANFSKHIFIFDEFDCILDVLVKKEESINAAHQTPDEPKTDWVGLLSAADRDERPKILEMMKDATQRDKKPDTITLGYLLQKLDGIEDANGRLIIATTNHPENINPALLRPGRFDLKLCLGNCTATMYEDILTNYFKGITTSKTEDDIRRMIRDAKLTPGRWSPLQVMNIALKEQSLHSTLFNLQQ